MSKLDYLPMPEETSETKNQQNYRAECRTNIATISIN